MLEFKTVASSGTRKAAVGLLRQRKVGAFNKVLKLYLCKLKLFKKRDLADFGHVLYNDCVLCFLSYFVTRNIYRNNTM